MRDFQILLSSPYPYISIVVAVIAYWFLYKQYSLKNFSGSRKLRNLLFTLRVISLLLIVFVLFQPGISYFFYKNEVPIDYILIDNSLSMSLDKTFTKDKMIQNINQIAMKLKEKDHQIKYAIFGKEVQIFKKFDPNQLEFDESSSKLQEALEKVSEKYPAENINNIFIISDGHFHKENVLNTFTRLPFQFYFYAIGDTIPKKDVGISFIDYDPVAYLNDSVKIIAHLESKKMTNTSTLISVIDDKNQVISSRKVRFDTTGYRQEIPLYFVPRRIGKHFFSVKVSDIPDELNSNNNEQVFRLNVLKGKLNILMVWGVPDLDYKFLAQAFSKDDKLQVTPYIMANNSDKAKFSQEGLERFDLFILGKLRQSDLTQSQWLKLNNLLEKSKMPFIYFSGVRGRSLEQLLFTPVGKNTLLNQSNIVTNEYRKQLFFIPNYTDMNSFFEVFNSETENMNFWSSLPLLNQGVIIEKINPLLRVLAYTAPENAIQNKYPAVVFNSQSGKRFLVFLASSLWRFQFASLSFNEENFHIMDCWNNMVRFLYFYNNQEKILISTNKDVYNSDEDIYFQGKVQKSIESANEDYERVELLLLDSLNHEISTYNLVKNESGLYNIKLNALLPGKYHYKIHYYEKYEKSESFLVSKNNDELLNVGLNFLFCTKLDEFENCNVFINDDGKKEFAGLNDKSRNLPIKKQYNIWDNYLFLILIVLTLSIEWFIRQKKLLL